MVILNANDLIERLFEAGFLEKKQAARAELLCTLNHYEPPPYLNIVMAIGAFFGTFFFYHLLMALNLLNQNNFIHLLAWGLGFIVVALLIYRGLKTKTPLMQSAAAQISLIFMWLGKVLMIYGLYKVLQIYQIMPTLDADERIFICMLLLTVLTYFVYNLKLDRFIFSAVTLLFLIYNFYTDSNVLGIFILFSVLLLATGVLFVFDRKSMLFDPLVYACVIALCACCALVVLKSEFQIIPLLVYNFILAFALIVLIYLILTPLIQRKMAFVLSILAIIALAFLMSPAVLLGIALLLLGYWKHDTLITIFASVFFIVFLAQYYYALPLSINQKTLILFASSLILFAVSYIVLKLRLNGDSHA